MQTQPNPEIGIHYQRVYPMPGRPELFYEVGCRGVVKRVEGTNMVACYGLCATDGPLIIPRKEVSRGSTMTAMRVEAAGGEPQEVARGP